MENKRRYNRYHTRAYCGVYDRASGKSIGCLVDLSRDGLKVMSEKPLMEDAVYKLKIVMHKEIDGTRVLELDAKCLWNKKSMDPNFVVSGFQITEISERTFERLCIFTKSSVFHYPETQKIKTK